ncbi:MAG TPA: phosphatase PAP2 family protein [Polyangiaceae bacterium]|nr:phosphatase PAP2 family protein [Polyangiaceae bacterium]
MPGVLGTNTGVTGWRPRGPGASWSWITLVLMPALLVLFASLGRLLPEQWIAAVAITGLAWAGPRLRQLSLIVTCFAAVGIGYRFLGPLMAHRWGLHVGDLWRAEHSLFPVGNGAALSDWLAAHTHPIADFVAGLTYITYLAEISLVAAWLFFRGAAEKSLQMGLAFLLVNLVGWAAWLLFPAAPPWYVDLYGVDALVLQAPPSPAGTARFDALIGFPLFAGFYSQSTNVFGAMPSLHACYPVVAAVITWSPQDQFPQADSSRFLRWFTLAYAVVMALSAVYLRHHYILDVVMGICLGWLGAKLVQRVRRSTSRANTHFAPDLGSTVGVAQ